MKATLIIGSPHPRGSCALLLEALGDGLQQGGAETVVYCVGLTDVRFCLGCKRCYEDGRCVQQDEAETIVRDILSSDVVAIAAPSYWAGVPAQLKVLIDRTTPYGNTNPKRPFSSKPHAAGVAIAVRAGRSEGENERLLDDIAHYLGHLDIETAHRFSVRETDSPEELLKKHAELMQELRMLGLRLAASHQPFSRFETDLSDFSGEGIDIDPEKAALAAQERTGKEYLPIGSKVRVQGVDAPVAVERACSIFRGRMYDHAGTAVIEGRKQMVYFDLNDVR